MFWSRIGIIISKNLHIDRGLILESLNAARVRKIGSFLKGNDEKGWSLTTTGLEFCKNSKHKFNGVVVRKKRLFAWNFKNC